MIRVATFNLNNLFDRFNFHASIDESPRANVTYRWRLDAERDLLPPPEDYNLVNSEGDIILDGRGPVRIELGPAGRLVKPKPSQHLQALLTRTDRLNADVLAVQEVENIGALREFNSLLDAPYPYIVLLEGNDPRFIDVGVLSRFPIGRAISHRWVPNPDSPNRFLFSRDIIAVEILDQIRENTLFTLWVGHFKSKFVDPRITDPHEIRRVEEQNDLKRTRQAKKMHDIINEHHNNNDPYIVCGDFNDHPDSDTLSPLLRGSLGLVDIFQSGIKIDFERPENEGPRISNLEDQPTDDRWTHRYGISNGADTYEQLDQLLLSSSLESAQMNAAIQRRTHWGKNKAGSDHDPVYVDLNIDSHA